MMSSVLQTVILYTLIYCNTAMFVRLIGDSPGEGRVEVSQDQVTWGTVCNDGWSDYNAHVVCREMGYKWGAAKRARYLFGMGTGDIFLDDVKCNGQETGLSKCEHAPWGEHNCVHTEDAAVTCHNEIVRLENGGKNHGIVYILDDNKTWGVQCGGGFDTNAASVVCRQLGYQHAHDLPIGTYGKVDDVHTKYIQGEIMCSGTETSIKQCEHVNTCKPYPYNYGAVICSESPITGGNAVRLVGDRNSGVVMTNTAGIWGSVCGSAWDDKDASVVCRQLGFAGGVAFSSRNNFTDGPFVLGAVKCSGTERRLSECNRSEQECVYSQHVKVAGVLCYETTGPVLRLIEDKERVGRLEIEMDGRKGGICDTEWDVVDARVACQQLGYADGDNIRGLEAPYSTKFMTNIKCVKEEQSIFECKNDGWFTDDNTTTVCSGRNNFAGVECYNHAFLSSTQSSSAGIAGSVLVFHKHRWYHVCDRNFGANDARLVCKENGYAVGVPLVSEPLKVDNKFRIFFLNMNCHGNNTSLKNCHFTETSTCKADPFSPAAYASTLCLHKLSTQPNVRVFPPTQIYSTPVVQIFGINGTICANGWDNRDARVYCRQFGYRAGFAIPTPTVLGSNLKNPVVWMSNMACSGMESDIRQCNSSLDKSIGACTGGVASVYCM